MLLRRSYPAAKPLSARTAISAPLPDEGYGKPWQTPQRPSRKGKRCQCCQCCQHGPSHASLAAHPRLAPGHLTPSMDRHAERGPGVSGASPCIPADLRPSRAQAQESTLQSAMTALNTAHTALGRQLPVMVHSPGLHHPMAYLHAPHELTLHSYIRRFVHMTTEPGSNSPCRNHSLQKCGDTRRKQAPLTANRQGLTNPRAAFTTV